MSDLPTETKKKEANARAKIAMQAGPFLITIEGPLAISAVFTLMAIAIGNPDSLITAKNIFHTIM